MTMLSAAIVQASPVFLNVTAGIEAAAEHIAQAADSGARLIAFGETWLGGYPLWLDEAPGAALWDHPGAKQLHRLLLEEAVHMGDARLGELQEAADRTNAVIVIGAHERVRQSLYNTQLFFRPQAATPHLHRKLVPTHGERLVWARGDGATLGAVASPWGPLGGLICWEHWMPLARAAMHRQGETVHVAQWPTVRETYLLASRHYAFEGRCFVLAAGTVLGKDDVLQGFESLDANMAEARTLLESLPAGRLQSGGSAIIGPTADILAGPADAEATLLTVRLDLGAIAEALAALDSDGHYSRPDIFTLTVNTKPQDGVVFD
ncbi:MAG: carbon-nitrogen hydrolase family protein [Pseudomonadota bacterium]